MSAAWTIRDGNGEYLPQFAATSAMEVGRRIVPTRFDAFRLHVSSSYREVFERAVAKVLAEHDWQIARMPARAPKRSRTLGLPLAA
jgi:hypothetical protein